MAEQAVKYTIAVPVFNEIDSLPELYHRITAVMNDLGEPWELILIDDGSTDGSREWIESKAVEDQHVRPVIFARNFGHQIGVTAGLDFSRGQAVVIMDADLQDPPEVIPDLVERWQQGYEVVYAIRAEREGETFFKRLTAALFYRLINRITDVDIPVDTGDFRLMDRAVVEALSSMREQHRFPRAMVAWVGFKQIGVPYRRAARFAGETKYPFRKMLRLALNAITGFSYFPLQIATYLGFVSAGLSILGIPVVAVLRLVGNQAFFGQASTLIAVLFLGGVQLISLGILGEYIGRIYDEAKGRPLYIVRDMQREHNKTKSKNEGEQESS
jgi:glycosyltransferase involved in cell wall biosynthesis